MHTDAIQGALTALVCVAAGAWLWNKGVMRPRLKWLEEDAFRLEELVDILSARIDVLEAEKKARETPPGP